MSIAIDFSSPKIIGGLDTFDPLDIKVAAWWRQKADEVYQAIPDLAGFVLKADSEGRQGPSAYGRTHADAANVLARALKPHGGLLLYRAFVYDHHMDWRNSKNDRARAAYDNFHPLDGQFDGNVILQIKHGPIDFQVREPVSPLFAALEKTNKAIELQITQEYTGQQRHLCYLVPMWKEALSFVGRVKRVHWRIEVGLEANWWARPGHGQSLWFRTAGLESESGARTIADEWTRQTFGKDPRVVRNH